MVAERSRRRALKGSPLLLALALGVAAWAGCGEGGARRKAAPPRHLLVVTIGNVRADRLTSHHYSHPTTYLAVTEAQRSAGRDLSIDGLVGRGVVFAHAFAPSPRTAASLATLFTGTHPLESCRFVAADLAGLEPGSTLPERFVDAGFRTAGFTAGFQLEAGVGLGRGFGTIGEGEVESTDESVLREAAAWVDAQSADERSFLWVHLRGPAGAERQGDVFDPASYDAALSATNLRIAGFLGHLADRGRLASTAVVLTSSSGAALAGSPSVEEPAVEVLSLGDADLHVPLVLHHPGSLTGRRVFDGVVGLERVAPTLLDWFELVPAPVSASLLPWIDGREPRSAEYALAAASETALSLRTADRRLVVDVAGEEDLVRVYATARVFPGFDAEARPERDLSSTRPSELRELSGRLGLLIQDAGNCMSPRVRGALAHVPGSEP